jgi:hypothetical protein
LGLKPLDPTSIAAVEALLTGLASKEDPGLEALRERLCQQHPMLAEVPWEQVEQLLQGGAPPQAEVLAQLLPALPPLATDTALAEQLATGWRATCERGIASGPSSSPGRMDCWVLYPWLLSFRGLIPKTVALAGLALFLTGLMSLTHRAWLRTRRDESFQRLLAARETGDLSQVAGLARDFLADDPEGLDVRSGQVTEAYQDALVSQMVEAARTGDSEKLQQISRESTALQEQLDPGRTPAAPGLLAVGGEP